MTDAVVRPPPKPSRAGSGCAAGKSSTDAVALARRARDARSIRSKKAVIEAAMAHFLEVGYAGFSISAIVKATGVARSTIYRHWPSQIHLMTAAVARLQERFEIPDHGDLRADLIEYHLTRAHGVFDMRAFQTLPSLLDAAGHEPAIINVINYVIGRFLDALRAVVFRAQARGELREDADPENVVRVIYGAMSARSLLSEQHSDAQIIAMIDLILGGIRKPEAASPP